MERNIDLIKNETETPDVVLLGDSITEHWQGTSTAKPNHADIKEVYEELFRKPNGIKGLALGISGDRVRKIYGKKVSHVFCRFTNIALFSVHNSCIDCVMVKCQHPFNPRCGGS